MPLTEQERKAKQKIRSARWYERNRTLAIQRSKDAYLADPVAHQEKGRANYQKNRVSRLAKNLEWRLANAGRKRAADKEWQRLNKRRKAETDKQYRLANKERVHEATRQWKLKNKARVRLSNMKRKALKKSAAVNLAGMRTWMRSILSKPFARCYYCEATIPTSALHFDHIVPLSEGGPHCVENLCVSCEPCNLSKSNKPLRTWIRMGQQILEL